MKLVVALLFGLVLIAPMTEGCKRMSAALRLHGYPYLFFDGQYVSLNKSYHSELGIGDVWRDWGVPYPDAMFVWSLDNVLYTFSANYYFSKYNNYHPVEASHFGGPFFAEGLDAAGSLDHVTVFLKGCNYVKSLPRRVSDPMSLTALGLPCDADAAMTDGDNLMVFKDDKMWYWTPRGVAHPVDTDTFITLPDFRLCKAGELAE